MKSEYIFEYVDLFCGAGGATTGIEDARSQGKKIARVIACVNHDPNAIRSHAANHKRAIHFTEDINLFDINRLPSFSFNALRGLWFSAECTNYSNAKGGQPRDADSRTLPNSIFRYIDFYEPVQPLDYILVENVREFMAWGDLDENGKPVSMDKGRLYNEWVERIKAYGFNYEPRILDAADYGAYTSRKRLFICFARQGMPIVFPKPTHSKTGGNGLKKWKAVRDVLDLQDEGNSIFTRKIPLVEKTLERIYAGLQKFAKRDDGFIIKYMGNNQKTGISMPKSMDEPSNTITTQVRLQKVFLSKYYSSEKPGSMNLGIDGPAHAIKTKDNHSIITSDFLCKYHGTGENILGTENPCSTLSTKDRLAKIHPCFLMQYNSGSDKNRCIDINRPCNAVPTNNRFSKIEPVYFINAQFGKSKENNIDLPAGSLTAIPKYNLCSAWLMDPSFNSVGQSLEKPAGTILACRKQKYLLNPQYENKGSSIDKPCFTLIAKMDKRPPYIVSTETGEAVIVIYDTDSAAMKKIKEFMADNGIVDIKMRMLNIPELKRIQGFPEKYILKGTQTDQKKFIGNAVVPVVPKKWLEALYQPAIESLKLRRAA
jgi:DNA (cytosine-5)-methyltransferase 1